MKNICSWDNLKCGLQICRTHVIISKQVHNGGKVGDNCNGTTINKKIVKKTSVQINGKCQGNLCFVTSNSQNSDGF